MRRVLPDASRRLFTPSVFLLVVGVLDVIASLGLLVVTVVMLASGELDFDSTMQPVEPDPAQEFAAVIGSIGAIGLYVVGAALGGFIVWGARRMRRLESHPLAIATAVAAMAPLTACCFLGVPVGIWTLIVLSRPEIREAFDDPDREADDDFWGSEPRP